MPYRFIPYAWVLAASALVSCLICVFAWRRRTVPGAKPFAILMATSAVWSIANALEMMGTDLPIKLFWANVQYICYNTVPVTWLVMTLQYTGQDRWLTRRRILLLLVIPVLTVVFAWTNPWHGLMRRDIHLDTSGPFPVVGKTYGPWFWVFAAFSYPLMLTACGIHIKAMLRMPRLYRWQSAVLLAGLVLPLLVNLSFTFKLSPLKYDVAPAMFSLGGVFYAWGLFRFKLFDLLPAGRYLVIESMGDGMFIFDRHDRLADCNPAARRIVGSPGEIIGLGAAEIFRSAAGLTASLAESTAGKSEVAVEAEGTTRIYGARWWPIADRRAGTIGRLLVLHDMTEAREAQREILRQQRITAAMAERESLARDLHDSLGQVLGYLNVQAQAVRKFLAAGQSAQADDYLLKMAAAAREAHTEVREFIQGIMSPPPVEVGLWPAIQDMLRRFGEDCGLETSFADIREAPPGPIAPAAEAQILRIIREALNNIRKHAEARRVWITVEDGPAAARITIRDDGKGFDPAKVDGEKSFGLRIMRDRAAAAGSRLEIGSRPGEGATISVEIPYAGTERESAPAAVAAGLPQKRQVGRGMRVLLVDDHTLFLDGLASLLVANEIEVAGTARDGLEALQKARELKPDIIVMDIQMPRCDGLTATRAIKAEMPRVKIVMLTMAEQDEMLFEAIKSGASGYLLKDLDGDDFVEMLLGLERGEAPLSPGIAGRFLEEFGRMRNEAGAASPEKERIDAELTPRQIEILTMTARGMTYKEIGVALGLSERSIKYHMGEITAK
ncbi:MAG: histidine kinase N-terminal 7TM domain-containing protein, partial [Bacteroidota bacterium]